MTTFIDMPNLHFVNPPTLLFYGHKALPHLFYHVLQCMTKGMVSLNGIHLTPRRGRHV